MAVDYFPHRSAEELIGWLDELERAAVYGQVSGHSSGGSNSSFARGDDRDTMMERIKNSLYAKDPVTFAGFLTSRRITRTRTMYSLQ